MGRKQDRRKAAYRAWLGGHTREQAWMVCQTVMMLETLPGSSRGVGIRVLINMLRRIASDMTLVVSQGEAVAAVRRPPKLTVTCRETGQKITEVRSSAGGGQQPYHADGTLCGHAVEGSL